MSRPPHIAPLDEALRKAKEEAARQEAHLAAYLDQHITALDEAERVINERVAAHYAVGQIEKAIQKLGYCLLGKPADLKPLNIRDEKQAARDRLAKRRADR